MRLIIFFIILLLIIALTIFIAKRKKGINRSKNEIDEASLYDTEVITRDIPTDCPEYLPTQIQEQPTYKTTEFITPTLLLKLGYFDNEGQKDIYQKLTSKFLELNQGKMSSIEMRGTKCALKIENFKDYRFKDSTKALSFKIEKNGKPEISIFLYPQMAIVTNESNNIVKCYAYNNIKIKNESESEFAPLSQIPQDAEITYKHWLHQRKDGGPDMRFSVNYLIGRYNCYSINFSYLPLKVKTIFKTQRNEIFKLLEELGFIDQKIHPEL